MIKKWMKEEVELLQKMYGTKQVIDLLYLFPGRTCQALKRKANKLKITGRNRKPSVKVNCGYCGKTVNIKDNRYNKSQNKIFYCNRKCKDQAHCKAPKYCAVCQKKTARSNKACCSRKCATELAYRTYIADWLSGKESGTLGTKWFHPSDYIERYLREKYHNKCQECGWSKIHPITKIVPLHKHHCDGNSMNNRPENLKLLCPNCHTLTDTAGSLNKGKGRHIRRIRYQQGLSY